MCETLIGIEYVVLHLFQPKMGNDTWLSEKNQLKLHIKGKLDTAVPLLNGTALILQDENYYRFDSNTSDIVTDEYPRRFSTLGDFGLIGDHVDAAYSDFDYIYLINETFYVKLNHSFNVRFFTLVMMMELSKLFSQTFTFF